MNTIKLIVEVFAVSTAIAASLAICDGCGGAPEGAAGSVSAAATAPFSGLVPICDVQPAQAPIGLCFGYPSDGGASSSTSIMYDIVVMNGATATESNAPFCPGTTSTLPPVTVAAELPALILSICGADRLH